MPCCLPAPPSPLCSAPEHFPVGAEVLRLRACAAARLKEMSGDTRVPGTWVKRLEPLPAFQIGARRSTKGDGAEAGEKFSARQRYRSSPGKGHFRHKRHLLHPPAFRAVVLRDEGLQGVF